MKQIYIEQLGREVSIRPGTSDVQGWKDVFECGYHVPPPEMPTPRTVLDLGANIGLTAAHYAVMWPEAVVVAVEMDFDNAELARRNFNGVVFQRAVTGFGGMRAYDTDVSADAYSLHDIKLRMDERPVPTISLLELAVVFFGNKIDFAKLDIEGSEWEIMEAAKQGHRADIQHLLVEFHDEPRDGPRIVKRGIKALEEAGYKARHHEVHPQAVFATKL